MSKDIKLDSGFEEVPLDEGFNDVPVDQLPPERSLVDRLSGLKDRGLNAAKGVMSDIQDTAVAGTRGLITKGGMGFLGGIEGATQEALLGKKKLKDYSKDDLMKLYEEYKNVTEGDIAKREERSPILSKTGEIAGMIGGGLVTGGSALEAGLLKDLGSVGLKQAMKAGAVPLAKEIGKRGVVTAAAGAPIGALYGAGESEGKLINSTPEDREKLLSDTVSGAATGSLVGLGTSLGLDAGKAILGRSAQKTGKVIGDYVQDNPGLRQAAITREKGLQGIKLTGDKARTVQLSEMTEGATGITNKLLDVRNKLGQNIERTLENASTQGHIIEPTANITSAVSDVDYLISNNPGLLGKQQTDKLTSQLQELVDGKLDPLSASEIRRSTRDLLDNYRGSQDSTGKGIYDTFDRFYGALDDSMDSIPGFKDANKLYRDFLEAGPEVIINKGLPEGIAQTKLGKTNKPKEKIFKNVEKMIDTLTNPGAVSDTAKKTYEEFISRLKQFDSQQPGLLKNVGLDTDEMGNKITSLADDATNRKRTGEVALKGAQSFASMVDEAIGKKISGGLNLEGRVERSIKNSTPVKVGKKLYNAGKDEIHNLALSLQTDPKFKEQGGALLKAIEIGDNQKKNALIFTLLQNPNFRQQFQQEE